MNNAEQRKRGIRELLKPSATILSAQPLGVSHRTPQTHRSNELIFRCPPISHPDIFLMSILLLILQPPLILLSFSFPPPSFDPLDPRFVLWYIDSDPPPPLRFHVAWDSLPRSNFLKNGELNYFCVAGRNFNISLAGRVGNDKSS